MRRAYWTLRKTSSSSLLLRKSKMKGYDNTKDLICLQIESVQSTCNQLQKELKSKQSRFVNLDVELQGLETLQLNQINVEVTKSTKTALSSQSPRPIKNKGESSKKRKEEEDEEEFKASMKSSPKGLKNIQKKQMIVSSANHQSDEEVKKV